VESVPGLLFLAAAGTTFIATGALRLPRWARLRGKQMDALAAQIAGRSAPAADRSIRPGESS